MEDLAELLPRILDMDDDRPPLNLHVSYDSSDRIMLNFREDQT